jgi:hypothetical protein
MRAISQYPNYGIQIRPQRQRGLGDGSVDVTQTPIYARWDPEAFIYEGEVERALKTFSFRGRLQHVDEATPVDARARLSLLDTEAQGWDESERELVENELRRLSQVDPDAFFIAEVTPLPAPFPNWDASSMKPHELVALLEAAGYDLSEARAYEINFGPKREDVIEALEDAMIAAEETDEVSVEA